MPPLPQSRLCQRQRRLPGRWTSGRETNSPLSSPPRTAEIGERPGAGKCLNVIKNVCSVTHFGRHPRPPMVSSRCLPGRPCLGERRVSSLVHDGGRFFAFQLGSLIFEFWAISAFLLDCFRQNKLLLPNPAPLPACSCLQPWQRHRDFFSPRSWCHQTGAAPPFRHTGAVQIRSNHWMLKDVASQ